MGKGVYRIYSIFVCLLMFLVGVVFIYTPGDMLAGSILGLSTSFTDADGAMLGIGALAPILAIYGIILVYYLVATVFPIDKIIGRIYPVFRRDSAAFRSGNFLRSVFHGRRFPA